MTDVDVIILSWDRMPDTIAAIESALGQQQVDHQVIVVDQGSKPDALEQLKTFCEGKERLTLLCNRENSGVPGGRNQASFAGKGKYIVALDNDAVFADAYQLEKVVQKMNADASIGVLAFRIMLYGAEMDDKSSWSYDQSMQQWSQQRFKTTRFVGAGHAIRREVFEKIGGYDARLFFLHEEVDLSRRIINAGYSIYYDPDIAVRHKVSAEHRVSWSGKRYFFDIRNKTYLHVKLRTKLPTLLFHTGLMVMKGVRSGYTAATLKGLGAALLMLPVALKYRFSDIYVRETEFSKAYFTECYPHRNMSAMQRIKKRIADAKKPVGT